MNKSLLALVLSVSVVCLGGCFVIVSDEDGGSDWPGRPGASAPDHTIAEIDAISKLSFESDKKKGYERIAAREGLSGEAQVHLVEAALGKLAFDNAKEEVLLKLIHNPSFCPVAERAILDGLDRLAFQNSRSKVLEAISERKSAQ